MCTRICIHTHTHTHTHVHLELSVHIDGAQIRGHYFGADIWRWALGLVNAFDVYSVEYFEPAHDLSCLCKHGNCIVGPSQLLKRMRNVSAYPYAPVFVDEYGSMHLQVNMTERNVYLRICSLTAHMDTPLLAAYSQNAFISSVRAVRARARYSHR